MSRVQGNGGRLYAINASSSVVARILQLTVFVWVNQYLLKRVDPEEYSLFPLVVSLMFFAEIFKNIVTAGIARFIVEADSVGNSEEVTRIVSSMVPVVVGAAVVIASLGTIAVVNLERLLSIGPAYLGQAQLMLMLLILLLCAGMIAAPFAEGAYIRQRFVALNLIELGCEVLRILVLLSLLFGVSAQVKWLVVASVTGGLVGLLIKILVTRRWIPAIRFNRDYVSWKTVVPIVRFGGWTSIQGITGLVSSTAPVLLLNRYGAAIDVAAFYLGRLPDIQIRGLCAVALAPAQPALTRIFALQGAGAFTELYYRGGKYHLWAVLGLVAPLLIFSKEIMQLYAGPGYASSARVMVGLLVIYPLLYASGMFFQVAHATRRIGAYYICDSIIQIVTLLGLLFAIVYLGAGVIGAVIAIAIATGGLHLALIWPMGLRLVGGEWGRFFRETLLPGTLPFVAACSFCWFFRRIFGVDSWFAILIGSALGFLAYSGALLSLCLDTSERSLLSRVWQRLRLTLKPALNGPVLPLK